MKNYPIAFWDPIPADVVEKVHQSSLEVLAKTGVNFHSEAALEIFKKHGLKVDGIRVYFDAAVIEKTLASCPKNFQIHARDPEKTVELGTKMVVATATGCLYHETVAEGRRPATLADFVNIQKLYQTSDIVDMVGYTPVYPNDVPAEKKFLTMTMNSLKNTNKPMINPMSFKNETMNMLKLLELAFEDGEIFKKKCVTGAGITPLNPLQYGEEALDTMIAYAERGQALFLAPASMIGLSSPINIMGTVVQQNAEILAGIALVQLINPGSPILYMPGSFTGYMKTAGCAVSGADSHLANAVNFQLARHKYGLPIRANASISDAKCPDIQAGYETALGILMAMMGGASMFHISLGIYDSILCFNPEKMMVDEEIFSRCAHITTGSGLDLGNFGLDVINEVGPGGSYITHKSTQRNFRKLWTPTVSNWDSYQHWEAGGKESVLQTAAKRVAVRLAAAEGKTYVSPAAEKAMAAIVDA